MANAESVVKVLERELNWLRKQSGKWSQGESYRRNDLRSACVTILRESQSDYNGWVKRAKKRKQSGADGSDFILIQNNTRWWTKHAVNALARLVELAISDVEACRSFLPDRRCSPLEVRVLNDEHRAKLRDAAKLGRQAQMGDRLRWEEDKRKRMGEDPFLAGDD